ncbi:MAG: hypothetical protein ACR2NV_07835 [Thermoleophilaceae bacterium]|jgi:hypothetical protein
MARTVVLGLSLAFIALIAFLSVRLLVNDGIPDVSSFARIALSGLVLALLIFGVLGALTGGSRE